MDVDSEGFAHAEAILVTEHGDPIVARGSHQEMITDPGASSVDFRLLVAGALSDLVQRLIFPDSDSHSMATDRPAAPPDADGVMVEPTEGPG